MKRKFKKWWSTFSPISTNKTITSHFNSSGCCDRSVVLQLPMQSVPFITNVVSLNPAQTRCTRYNNTW